MQQKKITFVVSIVAFILSASVAFAQTPPNFDLIKLEHSNDYKSATPFALQTANYILSTPLKNDNADRTKSLQFIYKWMTGTPDFAFRLDEAANTIFKGSSDLMGIYMAAMVKYSLENRTEAKDPKLVKLNGLTSTLAYCEKKENSVRMSKTLKKLMEARDKGELDKL
ncbi:MAG: hypothetical protein Q7T76_10320 [Ferruginibacter sp.]|nr:hypothetical protein [Ferruginibacter sp.]